MSVSALARKAGLDPTAFNVSKRHTASGRERWPSTESVAKLLFAINSSLSCFAQLTAPRRRRVKQPSGLDLPIIGIWRERQLIPMMAAKKRILRMPDLAPLVVPSRSLGAVEVADDTMAPFCRRKQAVVVDARRKLAIGGLFIICLKRGTSMLAYLEGRDQHLLLLVELPSGVRHSVAPSEIAKSARVLLTTH